MTIKYLLFDADGTLLDYTLSERQALKVTLDNSGFQGDFDSALRLYQEINYELWKSFERGEITQEQLRTRRFAGLRDSLGLGKGKEETDGSSSDDRFSAEALSSTYLRALADTGFRIEKALEVVRRLHDSGKFALAIVTNGLKDVQYDRLKAAELHDFFDRIIISEEIGVQKPKKEFFDKTFALFGSPDAREYIIIGDTYSSDIQGGINAGIPTCWYNPGKAALKEGAAAPDFEIQDLEELYSILGLE